MRSLIYVTYILALFIIKRCYSQELKINKIQRYDSTSLYLCFEKREDIELTNVKKYQLVIIDTTTDPVIETPVINQDEFVDVNTECITFGNSELQQYAGKTGTYFILTGRGEADQEVVFGTAQLDMPTFPEKGDESVTGCFVGSEDDTSLRINDHTKPSPEADDWSVTYDGGTTHKCFYPTEGIKDSAKVPCFVIGGLDDVGGKSIQMCVEVLNQLTSEKGSPEKVTVCGKQFTPDPLLTAKGPSLDQATLDYSVHKLNLTATLHNDATEMDIVLYSDSERIIYVKQSKAASLNLIKHSPEFKKYNVLLVGIDATLVKESDLTYFQDFKVAAQELGTGSKIMEVQWKKTEDVGKFSLTISTLASDVILYFTETTVNCPGDGETYCYGYFVDLDPGKYDVTFTPYMGEDENPQNSILFKPIEISSGSKTIEKEIMIQQTIITRNIQNEAVFRLCFHYTNDFKLVENAYEVILINRKGQWRRDKRFFQAKKGIVCSEGITLPSDLFEQNSVLTGVVIKRHDNGFEVIESGYVLFELS